MIKLLKIFFISVLAVMTWGTVQACLDRNVLAAIHDLWRDPWFKVTVYDTYFAFLTFYLWVFYKEHSPLKKIIWLISILLLGNFAIAVYMLKELFRLKKDDSLTQLLLRAQK